MLLVIDNYDSFTYNLVQYFQKLGQRVEVYRNDALTIEQLLALRPERLVISPGPRTPDDAGISLPAITALLGKIPILGVCLGHQALGQVFGARVIRAPQVMHGKQSLLYHHGRGLFKGMPTPFNVTRYHSLLLDSTTLPDCLIVDAWCHHSDGLLLPMAIRHQTLPAWGVQFHPESVTSEYGLDLLQAFLDQKA